MFAYYELAESAARAAGVTIMPYNNPDAAGYHEISTELLLRIAELPNVTALKISTIDVSIIETMMLANKEAKILAGVDTVTVHAGLAGACGGITGVGCIFPKASVTMQEYVSAGNWAEANKISQAMNSISYLDAQPLLLEYLKFAFGIHHNDAEGGLRTLGKKLTQEQIDDVRARYLLAKERLEALGLAE
ncbi:dihydrodipicolinate synthase family protein [Litorilituus sediminis]|uniref:Dihydrodipicolinate synthase family protein n=1 Tax=Litorilituus sediminis TaxID=718192 RepID=A0A4P6P7W7_9GAMM|nr:dihydrodipicolinate synthase family protein [Litorilituus sediminis]QBG37693.1 dihydrodipicolinate synthase family protein [Litorilituus sediminis]